MSTITQTEEDGIVIFTVPEQLTNNDEGTASELEEKIELFCGNHQKSRIIINLKDTKMIDAAGFTALINIKKKMESTGGQVELANPSNDINLHLEVFGLDHIVKIFDSIDKAEVGFKS